LSEILVHTFDGPGAGYAGVAELEGYVVDVDMVTTLDGSGEPASCKAFYVTDGPWEAMAFLDVRSSHYGGDPLIILGESGAAIESAWFNTRDINDSSEGDSVKAIFRLGSRFEGELVGCMKDTEFIGTSDLSKGFIGG